MRRLRTASRFSFFAATAPVSAEAPQDYCDNQVATAEWEVLVQASRADEDYQRLHALRLGLCDKINNGTVDRDHAIQLFETERIKTYQRLKKKEREELRESLS